MDLRPTIVKTLDLLIAETSMKLDEKKKVKKLEAWHIGLDDISDEQINNGLKKALKSTTGFLMACGEFRQLCLIGPGSVSIEDQAEQAWFIIMKRLNHTISPYFKDSSISEAIRRMGGWKNLCLMLIKDEPFRKKDFILNYLSIKKSGRDDFDRYLSGSFGVEYAVPIGYDTEKDALLIEQIETDLKNGRRTEHKLLKMITEKSQQNEQKKI